MVAGNDGLDYAVIRFDRAKVTPTSNVNGFVIDGLGPDPAFGDIACKLGRTTGYSCGVTWGPGKDPGTIVNQVCGQPGDSGAPVTVNNKLVGMIHGASATTCRPASSIHPAAHAGGHDVFQHPTRRHRRQEWAGRAVRGFVSRSPA